MRSGRKDLVSPERHFAPASDDFGSTPDLKTSAHPEEPDAAYAERPLPVAGEVQVTQRAEPHPDDPGTSVDVSHPDLQVSIQANGSGASTPGPRPEESDQAPGQEQHFDLEPEPTASGVPDPREGSKPGQRWSDRRWLRTEDALTREALIVPSPGLDTAEVRKSDLFSRQPEEGSTAQAIHLLRQSSENTPPEIVDREAETARPPPRST